MLQRGKSQWEPFYLFVVYILSEKFGFSIESPPLNYGPLFLFYSPCIQVFLGGDDYYFGAGPSHIYKSLPPECFKSALSGLGVSSTAIVILLAKGPQPKQEAE